MVGRVFLGRYETIRLLGEGGMGRVYLARQLDLGRQVVVKVMHDHIAADPKFRERFQRETLLMARFQHPYAVTLYDASLNDPQGPCIVMEYITRRHARQRCCSATSRLTPVRVGRLLRPALRGAAGRPRRGDHPPRPQAGQPDDRRSGHALRADQGHGLRPGQAARRPANNAA